MVCNIEFDICRVYMKFWYFVLGVDDKHRSNQQDCFSLDKRRPV